MIEDINLFWILVIMEVENMSWFSNISNVYIVEDNLHTNHESALVFPESLAEEEAFDLKSAFIDTKSSYQNLWGKIESDVNEEEARVELEHFIEDLDLSSFVKLNEWYIDGGRNKWELTWRNEHYQDEYAFLEQLPTQPTKFTSYQEAIEHIKQEAQNAETDTLKLWFLDRELGEENFRDKDILTLLDILSIKNGSIGIIYSGKTEALKTKSDIYKYVKDIVEDSKPGNVNGHLKNFLSSIKHENANTLFLEDESLINELSTLFMQLYESKADLNNLVWVMGKENFLNYERIENMIQKAKHGFELYKLLKIHTVEKKLALKNGLLYTTQLELEDIEHLKQKSITDGTNISNTLIRINDIYSNQAFNEQLSKREDYFQLIRNIESWKELEASKDAGLNFKQLLTLEKFDYNINSLLKPVMTGDIFESYSTATGQGKKSKEYYMLVTQECDCVIRKNGSKINRSVGVATLVEMQLTNDNDGSDIEDKITELLEKFEQEGVEVDKRLALGEVFSEAYKQAAAANNEKRITLAPFKMGAEYSNAMLLLRKTLHIDFGILDMCMLNKSGESKINLDEVENIKKNVITVYPKFYQEYLNSLLDNSIQAQERNEGFKKKIEERTLKNFTKTGNIVDYRIRRIGRLNMPHQAFVQAYYGLTQSNVGLPMDF